MSIVCLKPVTIIYYTSNSLELKFESMQLEQSKDGRVIVPTSFKADKSIVTIIEGKAKVLNSMGDRITAISQVA